MRIRLSAAAFNAHPIFFSSCSTRKFSSQQFYFLINCNLIESKDKKSHLSFDIITTRQCLKGLMEEENLHLHLLHPRIEFS